MTKKELHEFVAKEINALNENKGQAPVPFSTGHTQNIEGIPTGKSYREMFYKDTDTALDDGGFTDLEEYINLFASPAGRADPRLIQKADMAEGEDQYGGFLIPESFSSQILDVSLQNEIVRPRATVWNLKSGNLKVPGLKISDHSSSISGVIAYWLDEAAGGTRTAPEWRAMLMTAKKLIILSRASTELMEDTGLYAQLQGLFGRVLGWTLDMAFIRGTGAGMPLGVMNAPCTLTASKETGQAADTIVIENLLSMIQHLPENFWKSAIFIAHPNTLKQLSTMHIAIGAGGTWIPAFKQDSKTCSVLGFPVIFSEAMESLGDLGDIMLCQFSEYALGMVRGVRFEETIGASFTTDQRDFRAVVRGDGAPMWDNYCTLRDGSHTISPFIKLEAR